LAGHGALFLIFGAYTFLPGAVQSIPTLTMVLSPDDGRDTEQQSAPRSPRVIQLGRTTPPVTVLTTDASPVEANPDDDTGRSNPAPPPPANGGEGSAAFDTAVANAVQGGRTADLLTTTGESDRVVAIESPISEVKVPVAAIPSAQQEQIRQRILKWAQGLRDAQDPSSELTWEQDGRVYTAELKRRPALGTTDIESATVEVVTNTDGKELRTRMQLKRLAFSHFTQLIDHWDRTVQLHDDEIVGRFHSNSQITLGYDRAVAPVFTGKVTTAASGYVLSAWSVLRPRNEIFRAGFETGVTRISLPQRFVHVSADSDLANAQYHTFDRDTRITFYPDGTYGWQTLDSKSNEERAELGKVPMLMIADRGTQLHVRGTLSGNVLVYAPERIIVEGNLFYAHDPRHTADAPDYHGLASDRFIDVARPDVTGPGDIEIDAAIYARRRFTVTDEETPLNATLFIFGSLTAGTLSATEPRYATRVQFDPRFEHTRPPGFPMTNRYELENWDGQWRAAEDDEE
jgi:hypothetical protein